MVFLYRRLAFALIINFDDSFPVLQLAPFVFTVLGQLAYILYWQPMEKPLFNALATFNEVVLALMGYQMYLFTDYVPDPETRFSLGKVLLWLVYFDIVVNFIFLSIEIVMRSIRWIKR